MIDHNMQEKSLASQRLVYAIHNGGSQLSGFQITPALRKSCLLSKVQTGTGKECQRKSKQQCRFETQNKTWDPEIEKAKDGFRSNYQST